MNTLNDVLREYPLYVYHWLHQAIKMDEWEGEVTEDDFNNAYQDMSDEIRDEFFDGIESTQTLVEEWGVYGAIQIHSRYFNLRELMDQCECEEDFYRELLITLLDEDDPYPSRAPCYEGFLAYCKEKEGREGEGEGEGEGN